MAGSAPSSSDGGLVASINVTPLVDVMMVLLVVFLVTAKLMVSQTIPVDLPKAASGGEQQVVLAVSLDAQGALSVDQKPVADDALLDIARRSLAEHPDVRAVLHADGRVNHARVVRAMDTLRRAGLTRLAFAVDPEPARP